MFYRSAIWRGLNLLKLTKITVITFLEKNSKMKVSGEYFFRIREKTLSQTDVIKIVPVLESKGL